MRLRLGIVLLLLLGVRLSAQEANPKTLATGSADCAGLFSCAVGGECQKDGRGGLLTSNHNFPCFIGFMSNPLQNIDPRSLTQVVPIFGSAWVSNGPALPDADFQVYGPALNLGLTERLSVGLNQGGYTFAHIDRNDRRGPLIDRLRRNRGDEFGGTREGWLNIGGFAQYTLIEDVDNQFLLTTGLRVVAPCGSYEVFQGKGPAILAPYVTVGREFGNFHFLATGGYQFPARSGDSSEEVFYLNAHIDRQMFGWIYPLVEVNWNYHRTGFDVSLPTRRGFFNFDNFESTGNVVSVAAGVNFVLIRDRLEFGAVYGHGVGTQRNIDVDGLIDKAVLRF